MKHRIATLFNILAAMVLVAAPTLADVFHNHAFVLRPDNVELSDRGHECPVRILSLGIAGASVPATYVAILPEVPPSETITRTGGRPKRPNLIADVSRSPPL